MKPSEGFATPQSDVVPRTTPSRPQPTCPQSFATPPTHPHPTRPQATPHEISPIEPPFKRQRMSYFHQVPFPYPVITQPLHQVTTQSPQPVTQSSVNFEEILQSCRLPLHVESYIESSRHLDFDITPRKNIINPSLPDIDLINHKKQYGESFCMYLLMKAIELGLKISPTKTK